jgi:hypothetical protein
MALNLDRTKVAAAFFLLRRGRRIDGTLSLAGAELAQYWMIRRPGRRRATWC